jgi:hypothetical protein
LIVERASIVEAIPAVEPAAVVKLAEIVESSGLVAIERTCCPAAVWLPVAGLHAICSSRLAVLHGILPRPIGGGSTRSIPIQPALRLHGTRTLRGIGSRRGLATTEIGAGLRPSPLSRGSHAGIATKISASGCSNASAHVGSRAARCTCVARSTGARRPAGCTAG